MVAPLSGRSKQVIVEVTGASGSLTSAAATPSDTTPTPTKTANSAPTVRTTSSTRTSTAAPMPTGSQAKTYTTTFPLTENPISERGHWVGGSTAGGNLWGDVQTAGDRAFGGSQATTYGDPTAILTGTWGPNQTASAVVSVPVAPTGPCCHEVEVRLRMTISPNSITGYEVFCSVMPGDPYIQIARWNGANGSYLILKGGNAYCANGDVLAATVSGTNPATVTAYKNGVQVVQGVDTGSGGFGPWSSGNPGIGFYSANDTNWSSFGFSSFTATD